MFMISIYDAFVVSRYVKFRNLNVWRRAPNRTAQFFVMTVYGGKQHAELV